jgi:peptidyl-tRNA hydrolase
MKLAEEIRVRIRNILSSGGHTARYLVLALVYLRGRPYAAAERRVHERNAPGTAYILEGLWLLFGDAAEKLTDRLGVPYYDESRVAAWMAPVNTAPLPPAPPKKPPVPKLFLIADATLPPGLRAAQLFHAGRLFAAEHAAIEEAWYRGSNTIVLLEAPSKEELISLQARLAAKAVPTSLFHEPDLAGAPTALAAGPAGAAFVRHLPAALKT